LLPSTPDAAGIALLQSGVRLLEELVPSLAPSALHHAHVVACLPDSTLFIGSGSRSDLPGMFLLQQSLGTPWWIAESLLHESIHSKLYDVVLGHPLVRSGSGTESAPVVIPWRPSRLSGDNRFGARRVLAAFHVYVHLALLSTVAEARAAELEATYGPLAGMTDSRRARARARYLGHELRAQPLCWDDLGATRQELADWLQSLLDMLDPAPAPDGSTLHLYLDLYRRETDQLEQKLAEPTDPLGARSAELSTLARQDVASTRAILGDLNADEHLAQLDDAVAGRTDAELARRYPQIRRIIETSLIGASLDGYRMSSSGAHDTAVGEMVGSASDALCALTAGIPAPVAHA
jgi:hypothetical protein